MLGRAPLCCSYPQPCQHRGAEQGGCCVREPTRAAQANPPGSACHEVMHSLALRPAGSLGAASPRAGRALIQATWFPSPPSKAQAGKEAACSEKKIRKKLAFTGMEEKHLQLRMARGRRRVWMCPQQEEILARA